MGERNVWLVVNSASGSYNRAAIDGVQEALSGVVARPRKTLDVQTDGCPARGDLEAAQVDLLVLFAGDGTVNALVEQLEGWDGDVLVLPGGTANLLCHALHGERDADTIVSALPSARRIRHKCIRIGRNTALIEVVAGPGAVWSDVRESLRDGDLGRIAASGAEALRESLAGAKVRLSDPRAGNPAGYTGIRLVPCDRGVRVTGYGAESFGDYVQQGLAILRHDFRSGPHDDLGYHPQVVCDSLEQAPIELMIDGERRTGGPTERFVLADLSLNLLASQ